MIKKFIKINGISDMTNFVREATKVNGDVIVYHDKYVVNGKSLLGVMSVDISQGVTVEYPENANLFDMFVSTFVCEQ